MPDQIISSSFSIFGTDALKSAVEHIKSCGFQRALLLTDAASAKNGTLKKVSSLLAQSRIVYQIFDRIAAAASLSDVRSAVEAARSFRADVLIAAGAGAVADTAKAVSLLAENPALSEAIRNGGAAVIENDAVPLHIVFSSAGNARDMSGLFVLEDEVQRKKIVFSHEKAVPSGLVFDSSCIAGAPSREFSIGAASILASAVESLVCKKSWAVSQLYALEAVRLIFENARLASKGNAKAKEQVLAAQYFAGIAAGSSGSALGTAMANALEALCGIPFQTASSVLLPEVMKCNASSSGAKYRDIAAAMGAKVSAAARPDAFRKAAVHAVEKFLKELPVPRKFESLVLLKEDFQLLQDTVMKSPEVQLNPKAVTKKKIVEIMQSLC